MKTFFFQKDTQKQVKVSRFGPHTTYYKPNVSSPKASKDTILKNFLKDVDDRQW